METSDLETWIMRITRIPCGVLRKYLPRILLSEAWRTNRLVNFVWLGAANVHFKSMPGLRDGVYDVYRFAEATGARRVTGIKIRSRTLTRAGSAIEAREYRESTGRQIS